MVAAGEARLEAIVNAVEVFAWTVEELKDSVNGWFVSQVAGFEDNRLAVLRVELSTSSVTR